MRAKIDSEWFLYFFTALRRCTNMSMITRGLRLQKAYANLHPYQMDGLKLSHHVSLQGVFMLLLLYILSYTILTSRPIKNQLSNEQIKSLIPCWRDYIRFNGGKNRIVIATTVKRDESRWRRQFLYILNKTNKWSTTKKRE